MRNFIIYLFCLSGLLPSWSCAETIELQKDAPARYVVVPGDTLWGISAKYLKDPWKWPEIWGMNRNQIRNPQLIYPGDVILLETGGGKPRLKIEGKEKLQTLRLEPALQIRDLGRAIPSIPISIIGPFLSANQVVDEKTWDSAPELVAGQDESDILGTGQYGYVSGLAEGSAATWDIYGKPRDLVDPDTGKSLGLEVRYLGEARVVRPGSPAKILITRAYSEMDMGSRLLPVFKETITHYVPHSPDRMIKGRILSGSRNALEIGQNDIVSISLGSRDGLELGNVLAVYRPGGSAMDGGMSLPAEQVGLVLVFRIYEKAAYALVVQSTRSIHALDVVRTP